MFIFLFVKILTTHFGWLQDWTRELGNKSELKKKQPKSVSKWRGNIMTFIDHKSGKLKLNQCWTFYETTLKKYIASNGGLKKQYKATILEWIYNNKIFKLLLIPKFLIQQ